MGKFEIHNGYLSRYYPEKNDDELMIPDGVTVLGRFALSYGFMKKIYFPKTLKKIEDSAFERCQFLKKIKIPDPIEKIEKNTFFLCTDLKKVKISENSHLKEIGADAFSFCENLKTLYIPASVEKIEYCIWKCKSFEKIKVSKKNPHFCDIDGVLFNKNQTELRLYPVGKNISTYRIPETVEILNTSAFVGCTKTQKIIVSDSVKSIKDLAFAFSDIKEIELPDTIELIGKKIFVSMEESPLQKITIYSHKKIKYIISCKTISPTMEISDVFYRADLQSEKFEDKLMKRLPRISKIELSLSRLYYQNDLSEERKIFYQNYLAQSGKYALKYCIEKENNEYLRIAAESGSIKKSNITWAIDYAREIQNLNIIAFLMNYQHEKGL